MNLFQAARVVAAREINVKLRDRAYLLSTVMFLVFAGAGAMLPALLAGGPPSVAVADPGLAAALADAEVEVRTVADDQLAESLVRAEEVDAAVVAGPTVLALRNAPDEVVSALSTVPPVELLDPNAVHPALAVLVPIAFGVVFLTTSLVAGLQIAQSVTEEKQTRIVEILVASVPPRALLTGKVVAGAVLAFGQIALIALVAVVGTRIVDTGEELLSLLAPAIGWFIPFFVVGFLMLSALWAGVGALVSRQEDLASASMPVQMAVMVPFFLVVSLGSNATALGVMSYVPFTAPMAMPVRLFQGDVAGWEPALSLLILVAVTAALIAAGARLYEGSLLRTGARVPLLTAWRAREPVS